MKKYTDEYKNTVFEKAFETIKECVNDLPKFSPNLSDHWKEIEATYKSHHSIFPMAGPPNDADRFLLSIFLDNEDIMSREHGSFIKNKCIIDGRIGNERNGKEVVDVIVPIDVEDVKKRKNEEKVTVVFH